MPRGFNLEFRMYMEGVLTPFKSANIICTPNGVEASINIFANKYVYDLKPKTAVQIFYRDWLSFGKSFGWKIMFDGYFSAIIKEDSSTEGRMVGITCRDFRADIRKSPAYLSYSGDEPLGTINQYSMNGLYETSIVKGRKFGEYKRVGNREYDNQLCSLAELMRYIAGTAYGKGASNVSGSGTKKKVEEPKETFAPDTTSAPTSRGASRSFDVPVYKDTGKSAEEYQSEFALQVAKKLKRKTIGFAKRAKNAFDKFALLNGSMAEEAVRSIDINKLTTPPPAVTTSAPDPVVEQEPKAKLADSLQKDPNGRIKNGLFLDTFIRGMWTEAAGGTSVGVFTNKRVRMDKRFFVPVNTAGYNIWNRANAGLEIAGYMMGDSRFSSLEAAIMRCAALFAVRVYSCNTPVLIPVSTDATHSPYCKDEFVEDIYGKGSKKSPILDFVIDKLVRANLVDDPGKEFGGKYILNETMLLPPLEFTAPPNCNIFLPPFCNRTSWQYDIDADITRGYYGVTSIMSGYASDGGLGKISVQVPNTLFDISEESGSLYKGTNRKDKHGRRKPPLTLEERYKGITLSHGTVNSDVATDEVAAERRVNLKPADKAKADAITKKSEEIKPWNPGAVTGAFDATANFAETDAMKAEIAKAEKKKAAAEAKAKAANKAVGNQTTNALRRHAIIKYLNERFAGRIITIDMMFNPYPMCGFPGMFVDDEEAEGSQSSKTVFGMVQQVKHLITITAGGADVSTTVLMNNARFAEEPTDMDKDGNPLYMPKTDKPAAEIDIHTLQYVDKDYRVPDAMPVTELLYGNENYDMNKIVDDKGVYAKDFLSISKSSSQSGRSNISYLDKEYDPQHIALFYKKILQHNQQSFMIGNYRVDGKASRKYFVYDTMHEAVTELRANRKELLYDYEAAMKFVARNVCSADAFFQGILGLSVPYRSKYGPGIIYVCNNNEFDDDAIYDEYFGVTTDLWYSGKIDGLKRLHTNQAGPRMKDGLMESDGSFSSILETMPITAFIQERKDVVKKYISEANKTGQGIRFTVPEAK